MDLLRLPNNTSEIMSFIAFGVAAYLSVCFILLRPISDITYDIFQLKVRRPLDVGLLITFGPGCGLIFIVLGISAFIIVITIEAYKLVKRVKTCQ